MVKMSLKSLIFDNSLSIDKTESLFLNVGEISFAKAFFYVNTQKRSTAFVFLRII